MQFFNFGQKRWKIVAFSFGAKFGGTLPLFFNLGQKSMGNCIGQLSSVLKIVASGEGCIFCWVESAVALSGVYIHLGSLIREYSTTAFMG